MAVVRLNHCVVDLARNRVLRANAPPARLSSREAELLAYLSARPGEAISREALLAEVWGYAPNSVTRAVDYTVLRLRAKVEIDVTAPEHIVAVAGVGYRFEPAAPHFELSVRKSGLDHEVTSFFGREHFTGTLNGLWTERRRLVSLTGPPGVGKTRLAKEYARKQAVFGSVHFCDFTAARSLSDLLVLVGAGLEVQAHARLAPGAVVDQLGNALGALGPCLVILDNFERVAEWGPETLLPWLAAAPEVRFLATSRDALRLAPEYVVPVGPLPVEMASALFCSRAANAVVGWQCLPGWQAIINELMGRLDGLPLAIELAAVHVRGLTPDDILSRMDQRFRLLRHSDTTLRGVIDASWDALNEHEQSALAQSTVFRGGFTLDAAESIVALEAGTPAILDVFTSLRDKSLIRNLPGQAAVRLGHLESILDYARSRLDPSDGGLHTQCSRRHAAFYGRFGADDRGDRRALLADRANIAAALQWSIGAGEAQLAVDALLAMKRVVLLVGQRREFEALRAAVGALELTDSMRLAVLMTWAGFGVEKRTVEATRAAMKEALPLARRLGQGAVVSEALRVLAFVSRWEGRLDEAWALFDQSTEIALGLDVPRQTLLAYRSLAEWHLRERQLEKAEDYALRAVAAGGGDVRQIALVHFTLGKILMGREVHDGARDHLERALGLFRGLGDQFGEAVSLEALAVFAVIRGDRVSALDLHAEVAEIDSRSGRVNSTRLMNYAVLQRTMGNLSLARSLLMEAVSYLQDRAEPRHLAFARGNMGDLLIDLGDYPGAREQLEASLALLGPTDGEATGAFTAALALLTALEGDTELAREMAAEARASLEDGHAPEELCKAIGKQGEVEVLGGNAAVARAFLAEVTALADQMSDSSHSDGQRAVARLARALGANGL